MVSYMRAHAIQGPWEASERVLVCVNERPGAAALIRYARRLADRLHASWTAIHVDAPAARRFSQTERDRVAEALRIAERLGGQALSVPSSSVAGGVIDYARANNFTHIVTSTAQRGFWRELIRGSAAHEIIRRAGDMSVHVVPEQLTRAMKGTTARRHTSEVAEAFSLRDAAPYAASFGMVV